jgi:ubiquitin C-terminal hydrolase
MQPYIQNDIKSREGSGLYENSINLMNKYEYCEIKINNPKVHKKKDENYRLCGVILHFGTLNSGHYACFCRNQ